jgi:HTH-type transcriptional regulator/antitoxin HigA
MTTQTDIPPPGDFIREELEARGWSQRDLAYVLGVGEKQINKIIVGKHGVSADMAKALAAAFDVSPELFVNLQAAYELARAASPSPEVARKARLQSTFPIREMIKRGWLVADSTTELLEAQVVRFFESDSVDDILAAAHAAKRTRYDESATPAQIAWLHRVREIAREIETPRYSEKALRDALGRLKPLMSAPEEARHVPRILMECGVRFILVEGLPSEKIDGVCTWLGDSSPVIGLSMRRDRIDNFWFVLRHEIEHVLLRHGRSIIRVDSGLDPEQGEGPSEIPEDERVANEAAADYCIPRKELDAFIARKYPYISERDVLGFAARMQVHPGIVAGQVRNRLKRWNIFTKHLVKVRPIVATAAVVDGWGTISPVGS